MAAQQGSACAQKGELLQHRLLLVIGGLHRTCVLQGEDHKCLQQLALYLRDEFRNKRNLQVGRDQDKCKHGRGHENCGAMLYMPSCCPCAAFACSPYLVHPRHAGLQRDDVLDWPREFPKRIPQQFNGCDCGVFTLLFANYVGRAAPLDFTQAHIDNFRVRIVHELLHLCVE